MNCSQNILRFSILLMLSSPSIVSAGLITVPVDPGGRATAGVYAGLDQEQIFLETLEVEENADAVTFDIPLRAQQRASFVILGTLLEGRIIIKNFTLGPGDRLNQLEPFALPNFVPEADDDLGFRIEGDPEVFTGLAVDSSFVVEEGVIERLPTATFFMIDSTVDPFADPFTDPFTDPFNGSITVEEFTSFAPQPVPEPPTISLFILGLLGLYGAASFRNRAFRLRY